MQTLLVGASIFMIALLSACGGDDDDQLASTQQADNDLSTFERTVELSGEELSSSGEVSELNGEASQLATVAPLSAEEQVDQFNQVVVNLLNTKRHYLRDNENDSTSLNMLDASLFAADLSLIYRASDEFTRDELEQYWSNTSGIETASITALADQLNDLESLYQSTVASDIYTNSSNLWVQYDHLFKQSFIDWVYSRSTPILINTVDYTADHLTVSERVLEEAGIDLAGDLSADTRLLQTSHHVVTDAMFSQVSSELVPAYFRDEEGKLRQIEALKLQGTYQQSQQSEGTITLVPLENNGLQLALIQPKASQYDYLLSVLPAMLREVSNLEPTAITVHVPIMTTRRGDTNLQTLLEANGVSQIFDKEAADLTNLDRGGQYVSHIKHDHQFAIAPMGLTFDSEGILATRVDPENPFFNIDPGHSVNTFISHFSVYWSNGPIQFCSEPQDFYTFEPMLLALIDAVTGTIVFVVELDRVEGELVPTSSCIGVINVN